MQNGKGIEGALIPSRYIDSDYPSALQTVYFRGKPQIIIDDASNDWNSDIYNGDAYPDVYVPWAEGEVEGAPWGFSPEKIHYNYMVV